MDMESAASPTEKDSVIFQTEELSIPESNLAGITESSLYVDSARRAWCTVIGGWLIQFAASGMSVSFGVFQEFYSTTWLSSYSSSAISWIGSLQLFLSLVLGPIGGKAVDKGYFKTIVGCGCVIFTFCFFMSSLAKPGKYYQIILSQGLGMGVGVGLVFVPIFASISYHFKRNHALAMGVVASSSSVGGVVFPIMLNYLLHGSIGFAWGVRIAAFICLTCFVAGFSLISLPEHISQKGRPDVHQSLEQDQDQDEDQAPHEQVKLKVFDVVYNLFLCGAFMAALGLWFPLFYVQIYAEQHGVSQNLAFYSIAISNFSGIFGRIIPNYLGDRYGVLNAFLACTALNGLIGFALFGADTPQGMILFCIVSGFFFGASNALYSPFVTSISSGRSDVGKRIGIAFVPAGIGSFVGPPIAGAILGPNYAWWKVITYASVMILTGFACLVPIKIIQIRRAHVAVSASLAQSRL